MKTVYPIILTLSKEGGYIVSIPDLDTYTQGENELEAIEMARDAISLWIVDAEDEGKEIPSPSRELCKISGANEIVTLVDIDTESYRRKIDNRTIRKNLSIPKYLNELGELSGINFSKVLTEALKKELNVN